MGLPKGARVWNVSGEDIQDTFLVSAGTFGCVHITLTCGIQRIPVLPVLMS